jgi:flagellar motility protein MotE (MotC chaperone)
MGLSTVLKHFRILPIFIIIAVASFAVRVGIIYGDLVGTRKITLSQAVAEPAVQENKSPEPKTTPIQVTNKSEKNTQEEVKIDSSVVSATKVVIVQKLKQKRAKLADQENKILQKEAVLKVIEEKIDHKFGELQKRHDQLVKVLEQIKVLKNEITKEEEGKLMSLVKIYGSMKPKSAAKIFNELDMRVLIDVISRMREAIAAPILASMTPLKAKAVTTNLARKKDLPSIQR